MVAVVSITFQQPRIPNIMGDEGRGEKGGGERREEGREGGRGEKGRELKCYRHTDRTYRHTDRTYIHTDIYIDPPTKRVLEEHSLLIK